MAYPENSDFISGEPLAAWFLVGIGEGRTYGYATQGETANKRIQRALNAYFAGREFVSGAALTVDGVIGTNTLNRLRTAALEHARADSEGGYLSIAERIAADIRARTLSPLSYRWGLWLAYVRSDPTLAGRTWGDVVLTANTRLPVFGQAPDDDGDAGGRDLLAVRWLVGVQEPPGPQARSSTRTPLGSTGPTPGTPQATTTSPATTTGGGTGAAIVPVTPAPAGVVPAATTPRTASGALETEYAGMKGKYWLLGGALLGVAYLAANSKPARSSSVRVIGYGTARPRRPSLSRARKRR